MRDQKDRSMYTSHMPTKLTYRFDLLIIMSVNTYLLCKKVLPARANDLLFHVECKIFWLTHLKCTVDVSLWVLNVNVEMTGQFGRSTNVYIFDLRLFEKPIEPSVVHFSMNAMDHAKWRDVKTADAFGDLIGRCYCCDDVAVPLMQPVMWSFLQGMREK